MNIAFVGEFPSYISVMYEYKEINELLYTDGINKFSLVDLFTYLNKKYMNKFDKIIILDNLYTKSLEYLNGDCFISNRVKKFSLKNLICRKFDIKNSKLGEYKLLYDKGYFTYKEDFMKDILNNSLTL